MMEVGFSFFVFFWGELDTAECLSHGGDRRRVGLRSTKSWRASVGIHSPGVSLIHSIQNFDQFDIDLSAKTSGVSRSWMRRAKVYDALIGNPAILRLARRLRRLTESLLR